MTSSRFKGWTYFFYLSILMLPLLFFILFLGEQNQKFYFFEGFEGLSSMDLLFEDFDLEVIGEVPNGITSESAHSGSNSRFVGPSTCNSFCFDSYSVMTTLTSINLTNDEYAISYWRRESNDFGGSIQILIDGQEVYNEDDDDGVCNTGQDTGWYQRFFSYTGPINSLTFWETDLTSSNTIYLDDIIIQNETSGTETSISLSLLSRIGLFLFVIGLLFFVTRRNKSS